MRTNFNINIKKLWLIQPPFTQYEPSVKVSKNFTLDEYKQATKMRPNEWDQAEYIPIHENIIKVVQLVRDTLNKPVHLGSAYRTVAHELFKNRQGDSQHTQAHAIDLNGVGLVNLLEEAFNTKNELYQKLKELGITSYGFYDWGVHLDMRQAKQSGKDYHWDNRKKKAIT